MNANDIDRTLADWFESEALAAEPADGLDRALTGARRRRPRTAWLAGSGSHWGWEAPSVWSSVAVPALIVVALLGVLLGGLVLAGAPLLDSPTLPTSRLGALAYAFDGDIFVADWDGANPVRIADGLPGGKSGCGSAGYWAEGPMWSPDGQWLTYRSARSQVDCDRPEADTIPTVLVSDPAGNVVASVPGVGWRIPWSPDSSRFATWLDLYPSTRIGVYGPDGVRHAIVAVPPGMSPGGDYDPAWSPDGQSLLVPLSVYHEQSDQYTGENSVWELPIDGSPPRELPAGDVRSLWSRGFSPGLSPDGKRVAYSETNQAGTGAHPRGSLSLKLAETDGSQPRELVDGDLASDFLSWAWSPTGDRIAFASGEFESPPVDLHMIDAASGAVTVLDGSDDIQFVLAFSPEGDRILYSRSGAGDDDSSLWSVDLNGSEPQQLVNGPVVGDWQSVTPDQ